MQGTGDEDQNTYFLLNHSITIPSQIMLQKEFLQMPHYAHTYILYGRF